MITSYIVGLLGGLALFLYGMHMMSVGLENAAGNKMKLILEKLTANRFIGVLVGALGTAVIQSSSATTVMVVGFVNSGMMNLRQAVWVIMGANIGTTITGQLIALDVGKIAPIIAFVGVVAVTFFKNEKINQIGQIFAGIGILFIGMEMMSTSMAPLGQSEMFVGFLTKFDNPLLGILAGTVFTAIIQSSSASVGILQALAGSGAIGLNGAAFVLFGQNIGTCITAMLASVGAGKNAKRTTIIHVMFNVIGTIVFTLLCLLTPLISVIYNFTPGNPSAQIANLHTLFNIATTLLLLPFGMLLTKFATFVLKGADNDKKAMESHLLNIKLISSEKLGISVVCKESIKQEIERMMKMTASNVKEAFTIFKHSDNKKLKDIEVREEYVDFLNKEISNYITRIIPYENTKDGGKSLSVYYTITSNVERISDHAMNIAEYSTIIEEKKIVFSKDALSEIEVLEKICNELFLLLKNIGNDVISWHEKIACMEQKMDDITKEYRNNMFNRMANRECLDEGHVLFSEMLTDFERIGDHALNISNEIMKISH